jgi:hypothetical protein
MNRLQRFVIILLCTAGFSSCGAVSSGYIYPGETGFLKAEPSRFIYGIDSEFDKFSDLNVYLYKGGDPSKLPLRDVTVKVGGNTVERSYTFGVSDPGTWVVAVEYAAMSTNYMITVLNAEEEAYYDSNSPSKGGINIIITGP